MHHLGQVTLAHADADLRRDGADDFLRDRRSLAYAADLGLRLAPTQPRQERCGADQPASERSKPMTETGL